MRATPEPLDAAASPSGPEQTSGVLAELKTEQTAWAPLLKGKDSGSEQVWALFRCVEKVDGILSASSAEVSEEEGDALQAKLSSIREARQNLKRNLSRVGAFDFSHVQKVRAYKAFFKSLDSILDFKVDLATVFREALQDLDAPAKLHGAAAPVLAERWAEPDGPEEPEEA